MKYAVKSIAIIGDNAVVTTRGFNGNEHTMTLTREQGMRLWLWLGDPDRPLFQNAFPDLTVGQREQILSGLTDEEFDELFPEDQP